jgi:predicted transcriptional regulator
MTKSAPAYGINDKERRSADLSAAERDSIERAEADIKAGRIHEHDEIAQWLRERASAIVERARKALKTL